MRQAILDAATETVESLRGSIDRWNNTKYIVQSCQNMDKEKNKLKKIATLLQADPKLASYRLNKLGDNISNLDGWCPIHCAAYYNRIDVAQVLLEHGASAWSRDLQGRTSLHIAAERGNEEICEFLKEQMAKERNVMPIGENAPTDLGGTTPLGWAAFGSASRTRKDSTGVKDSMKKLLFSPGDKTILPRTPRSNRGGKSPWKAPGTIDRENLVYGYSEANGWKESMEDRICISCPVPGRPAWSFFAVLDGHGGDYVASYLAENLPHILVNEVTLATAQNTTPETIVEDAETTVHLLENLLTKVCATAEKRLAEDPYLKIEVLKSGSFSAPHDSSGSTGTLCLVTSNYVAIANVGDSRAVRAHRDPSSTSPTQIAARPMSRDHKFNIPEERARAVAASAVVSIIGDPSQYRNEDDIQYQVECPKYKGGGDKLRMSRSFGDFWLKNNKELPEDQQAVVAIPEIVIHTRSTEDAFIVLACDGIFDVMNNDEVVNFIADKVGYNSFGGPVGGATPNIVADSCYSLLEHCVQLGAYDNLSCIVIMLGPPHTIRRRSTSPTHTPIQSLASTFAAKLEFESPGEKGAK
jgi:serine/threonine protein phosphatase PrpC